MIKLGVEVSASVLWVIQVRMTVLEHVIMLRGPEGSCHASIPDRSALIHSPRLYAFISIPQSTGSVIVRSNLLGGQLHAEVNDHREGYASAASAEADIDHVLHGFCIRDTTKYIF